MLNKAQNTQGNTKVIKGYLRKQAKCMQITCKHSVYNALIMNDAWYWVTRMRLMLETYLALHVIYRRCNYSCVVGSLKFFL